MTNDKLTRAYLEKAKVRIEALHFYHSKAAFSDVVREAQECVELLLKALLRHLGLEVPKVHDVGRSLTESKAILPNIIKNNLSEIVSISRSLRKDRELAFYGTEDWIPTEEYGDTDSKIAIDSAEKIFDWVSQALK